MGLTACGKGSASPDPGFASKPPHFLLFPRYAAYPFKRQRILMTDFELLNLLLMVHSRAPVPLFRTSVRFGPITAISGPPPLHESSYLTAPHIAAHQVPHFGCSCIVLLPLGLCPLLCFFLSFSASFLRSSPLPLPFPVCSLPFFFIYPESYFLSFCRPMTRACRALVSLACWACLFFRPCSHRSRILRSASCRSVVLSFSESASCLSR